MDAGNVEALGDRLGLDRGGPIYRRQDAVELFTPLIREKVAKSAQRLFEKPKGLSNYTYGVG